MASLARPCSHAERWSVRTDQPATAEIVDPDLHDVSAPQLAVDRQIEQRSVSDPSLPVKTEADGPDVLRFERRFAPSFRPAFHGFRSLSLDRIRNVP
ncbi:hypothetical protein IC232_31710 [Microvirga sp. BT688]|nr:hypothetical protein [Microvirga sp.]